MPSKKRKVEVYEMDTDELDYPGVLSRLSDLSIHIPPTPAKPAEPGGAKVQQRRDPAPEMDFEKLMGGAQPPPPIDLSAPVAAAEPLQDDGAEFDGQGAFDDFDPGQGFENVRASVYSRAQET